MQVQAFLTALPVRYVQQLLTYSCWQKVQKNHRSSFFLVSHSHGLTSRRQTALARTAKRQRPAQYYPRLTHEQPCHVEGFPLTHQTLNAENCANHPASQFWSTIFEPAAIVVRAVSSVLQLQTGCSAYKGSLSVPLVMPGPRPKRCTNPACDFLVHPDATKMGSFCCKKCHYHYSLMASRSTSCLRSRVMLAGGCPVQMT